LRETILEQQIKISKLECLPKTATPTGTAGTSRVDFLGDQNAASTSTRFTKSEEYEKIPMEEMDEVNRRRNAMETEWEAAERAEREASERAEEAVRARPDRIAREKAWKEALKNAERELKENTERREKERREQEERDRIEMERIQLEEKERIEKEAKEMVAREAEWNRNRPALGLKPDWWKS
jgi:hypothetical protein